MSDKNNKEDNKEETEETPENSPENGEDKDAKTGGKKKLIMLIAISVLVIAGGVGGAFFMGLFGGEKSVPEVVVIPPGPPVYFDFPPLVLDLKKTSQRVNYIKIKVVAEIATRDLPVLKENELKITDGIQSYLRSQTRDSLTGAAGTERMRTNIEKIINKIIAPVKFEGVLFREILLQ